MKITRELIALLALLLVAALVGNGALGLYRLAPHPTWCLCDTCHSQFDNERGE